MSSTQNQRPQLVLRGTFDCKKMERQLTIKQARFVEFYDGNGYKAAKAAGYKGNYGTLRAIASENLTKPNVKAAIKGKEKKRNKAKILSVAEIQEKWSEIIEGIPGEGFDTKDRMKAMHDLTKSHGGFLDRIEEDRNVHITIERKKLDKPK
jgi:phage terminase small subunit